MNDRVVATVRGGSSGTGQTQILRVGDELTIQQPITIRHSDGSLTTGIAVLAVVTIERFFEA